MYTVLEVVEFDGPEVEIGLAVAEPTRAARKRVVDACMIFYASDRTESLIDME